LDSTVVMHIDIRTLAVVLAMIGYLQAGVLVYNYILNRSIAGGGYWAVGSLALATGFLFLVLRDIPSIAGASILAANTFLLSGQVFLYLGVTQFIRHKGTGRHAMTILVVVVASLAFNMAVMSSKDQRLRVAVISAALALVSLATVNRLVSVSDRNLRRSAGLSSVGFAAWSVFLVLRTAVTLLESPAGDFFDPVIIQVAAFIVPIGTSTLWTFGNVFMINQFLNERLVEERNRFELFFETGLGAAVISRLDTGTIVAVNDSFTEMTGWARVDALGKTRTEMNLWLHPEDQSQAIEALSANGQFKDLQTVLVARDGRSLDVLVSGRTFSLFGEAHVMTVTSDISSQKRAERDIQHVIEEKDDLIIIQARQVVMGEIVEFIMHQWKQDLYAVSLYVQALQSSIQKGASDVVRDERTVVALEQSIRNMMDTLLLFRNFLSPRKESIRFSPESALDTTLIILKDLLWADHVEIVRSSAPGLTIFGNPAELEQVFINIIMNACEAIRGHGLDAGFIRVEMDIDGSYVRIVVEDNGGGIPERLLPTVLDKFVSSKAGGSGLGLYICRMILERSFGGTICAGNGHSGAVITIRIPRMD